MARPPSTHPTDGELEILQVVWQAGLAAWGKSAAGTAAAAADRHHHSGHLLNTMLDKKLVGRKSTRQGYLWSAKTTRQTAAGGIIRKLVDLVFDGSAQRLVAHLLESGGLQRARAERTSTNARSPLKERDHDGLPNLANCGLDDVALFLGRRCAGAGGVRRWLCLRSAAPACATSRPSAACCS